MADVDQATRYRRVKRLGAGGMTTVTLAEDTVLGRLVALKRVHGGGDERGMLRLKREALVGASLNHPNLVFVYDAQLQEDGDVVIVMEYVEGETLADVIRTRGALAPPEAIRVLRGVATALDAIHERGIIHRDVKPANVLLGRDGTIKLADLGVADVADRTRITESGAMVGSFSYMAPEQLNGADPSPAMDVYALGAVAYEMLAGEKARPEGNPLALAHAISTQPPPDLRAAWPHAPAAAAAVLQRAMSADLGQRPASAGELVRRLEAAFEPERPTEDRRPAARPPAPAPRRPAPAPPATADPRASQRRRSALVPALLALVALAVAGVIVVWLSSSPGRTSAGQSSSTAAGTAHRSRATATTRSTRSTPATTAASHSTTSTPTTLHATSSAPATSHSTSSTPATSSSTPASSGSSAASSTPAGSSSTTPAGVVEQFYTAAAQHQYATAWALADPNLRNQLGGYAAFQNLMSSVRSIT
ncbi:MAG: serine/threonine protein kinase, partial [Solirubrobacterales bacterium]|nr:serine/threonine protein kinase [Solirubrobacterales bacterium]